MEHTLSGVEVDGEGNLIIKEGDSQEVKCCLNLSAKYSLDM